MSAELRPRNCFPRSTASWPEGCQLLVQAGQLGRERADLILIAALAGLLELVRLVGDLLLEQLPLLVLWRLLRLVWLALFLGGQLVVQILRRSERVDVIRSSGLLHVLARLAGQMRLLRRGGPFLRGDSGDACYGVLCH